MFAKSVYRHCTCPLSASFVAIGVVIYVFDAALICHGTVIVLVSTLFHASGNYTADSVVPFVLSPIS